MTKFPILILIFTSFLFSAQNKLSDRFEAENGLNENLVLQTDSLASNFKFLRMNDSGSVSWKITLKNSGWYNLVVRYRAFGGEKEQLIVKNGKDTIPTGFPISDRWNTLKRAMSFNEGQNTVSISKSWGNMDIDFVQIEPVDLKPELVPLKNEIYLSENRDLVFKWNAYGKNLKSVFLDEKEIQLETKPYPYQEEAWTSVLQKEKLSGLKEGKRKLQFVFDSNDTITSILGISGKPTPSPLKIIAPYVEHGSSVLVMLPTGKILMIDTGKDWVRDQIIIPFLLKNKITKVDYLMITHYHDDHDSGDKGEKIMKMFSVDHFIDYNTYKTGTEIPFEGTTLKILNSSEDGTEENTKSLSVKISFNGFSYTHGGDTYGLNQEKMNQRFPDDLKTDVFMSNHHFHGSVNVDYLRKLDPVLVLIQAQEAIYARSAYMIWFREETEKFWRKNKSRYRESLPTLEIGTVVIRVRNQNDWTYETHQADEELDLK